MEGGSTRVWWPAYVRVAIGLALSGGFGIGALLFAAQAWHWPMGVWWPATAEVHAHIQLFGWAGLLVVGVALHFLPRLRGGSLAPRAGERIAWGLLVCGLILRALSQPLLAAIAPRAPAAAVRLALVCSGALEVAGATVVLCVLAAYLRHGPPLRSRAALWPVLPFFVTAFAAYWLALLINLIGLSALIRSPVPLMPDWADVAGIQVALYGFLVPVSVAMSERTFPMFFRTPRPHPRLLQGGLLLLLIGLLARIAGDLAGNLDLAAFGSTTQAVALVVFVAALGVFAPRRPLPRQRVRVFGDPLQLHAITAYCWLALAAVALCLHSLSDLGMAVTDPGLDGEVHAIGAGFVTLLILGVGAQLLPGFANRRLRDRRLCWLTLVLGNAAALLRAGPLMLPLLDGTLASILQSLSGVAALFALALFAYNVPLSPRRGACPGTVVVKGRSSPGSAGVSPAPSGAQAGETSALPGGDGPPP